MIPYPDSVEHQVMIHIGKRVRYLLRLEETVDIPWRHTPDGVRVQPTLIVQHGVSPYAIAHLVYPKSCLNSNFVQLADALRVWKMDRWHYGRYNERIREWVGASIGTVGIAETWNHDAQLRKFQAECGHNLHNLRKHPALIQRSVEDIMRHAIHIRYK
jgi:hypothetical protein